MRVPDPAFYRRPGAAVNIDLGSLAKLGEIEDGIKALDEKATGLSAKLGEATTSLGSQISYANTAITSVVNAGVSRIVDTVQTRASAADLDTVAATVASVLAQVQTLPAVIKQVVVEALEEHDQEVEHADFTPDNITLVAQVTQLQLWLLQGDFNLDLFHKGLKAVEATLRREYEDPAPLVDLLPEIWDHIPNLEERSEAYWDLQLLIEHIADSEGEDDTGDAEDTADAQQAQLAPPAAADPATQAAKPAKAQARKAKAAAAE